MTKNRASKSKEKIVEAASDLFYRQGYQATVVNQIVEQAGVSKPTFYAHFPSKDDLCLTYLDTRRDMAIRRMMGGLKEADSPYERFLAPIRTLKTVMSESDYRGCSHYNMLIEIADNDSKVAKEIRDFNDLFRQLLSKVSQDLLESDEQYASLNPSYVADAYYLIFCGAIMFSQEYHATWPLELAESQVVALLK
jgi:AcrR family transcriptional regulator